MIDPIMSQPSRTSVNLDVAPGERRSDGVVEPDSPFRILMLGDFSGRRNRGIRSAIAGRRPLLVDRDCFDDVMDRLQPSLKLPGLTLKFAELDDFHPDNIYRNTPVFQELSEARNLTPQATPPKRVAVTRSSPSGGGLLDAMLEDAAEDAPSEPEATGDLADFIRKAVAPYLVEREDPRKAAQVRKADSMAATAMRGVLHQADFQALEAAWRAVWMLVRGLDTDENLKLYILDVTREEIEADPEGVESLFSGRDQAWALIAADYVFGQSGQDVQLLTKLGRAAQAAGAPLLAEATPPSGTEAGTSWEALRRSPEAHWIGLALPRFLLRLPYGPKTSPVESFEFDEMPVSAHQDYLWGNPAFCCAYLLGQSFQSDGWEMQPGTHRQLEGLPVHTFIAENGPELKPCAEILMTEKDANFLMEEGIMPLASMKGQDSALLVRFQSIATPLAALEGGWR